MKGIIPVSYTHLDVYKRQIYSPINHPFTPSKNLYFCENFGSKFIGDDNLIFHAVYRITEENEGQGKKLSFGESFG